jgi:hypothetical protein
LRRDQDPFLPLWELDRTSRAMRDKHGGIDLDRQRAIERAVSDYIREYFSFVVVRVDEKLAQPPHCLLLHEPNLSPEVWSTAVMSLILFVADSSGGGAGENSD